jgi:glycosyltransferase involved in cell wall biosynthesis
MQEPILVLIPARNEAARLPRVLAGVREVLPSAEVVVVDDASTDETAAVVREAGATVLRLPLHLGYGGALQTGYRYAARRGVQTVVQMDGDGQHDASSIPTLLEEMNRSSLDLVIGSRFLGKGPDYEISTTRRIGLWFLRKLTAMILHRPMTDPTSGFQALSSRLVRFYAAWDGFPVDFPDADVLVWISRCGFRVGEVPVVMHMRKGGRSMHDGLRPILYALRMGVSLPLWAMFPARVPESTETAENQ